MSKLVSIVTGNSNSGSACIDYLVSNHAGSINIRAVFRSEEKSKPYKEKYPGLEVVCGVDATRPETTKQAFEGAEAAFIVTVHDPARGFEDDARLTQVLIDSAVECGVKYIILVASFTVKDCQRMAIISSRFKPLELHLEKLGHEKGLQWTVLRGGVFMENLLNSIGKVKEGSDVFSYPKMCAPLVDTADIGASGAVCLMAPDWAEHHGKYYEMNGPEYVSGEDIAECLSGLLKRQIKYQELLPEVYSKFMDTGVVEVMKYMAEMGKEAAPLTQDAKNLTGRNGTLEEFLRKHL